MTSEPFLTAPTSAPTATSAVTQDEAFLNYPVIGDGETIPAPRTEVPTAALLVLAEQQDLVTFRNEWTKYHGALAADLVDFTPPLDRVKEVLATTPDWVVFGGHFEDGLYNDDDGKVEPIVKLTFYPDYLLLQYGYEEMQVRRDNGLNLHRRLKVSLWRGCSVFREPDWSLPDTPRKLDSMAIERIRAMRALLGPHLMLGFNKTMRTELAQLVFGGTVTENGVSSRLENGFLKLIEGRTNDVVAVREAWLTCTSRILARPEIHDHYTRFAAVDPDGYYWTNDKNTGEMIRVTRV